MSREISSGCFGVREPMSMAELAKVDSFVLVDDGRTDESVASSDCCVSDIAIVRHLFAC